MVEENQIPIVLVIDDSELIHRLLETRLQGEHLVLHFTKSSDEGFKKAVEKNPDLILLDVEMEGMDGFGLLEKLKEDPRTRNIAVIFIAATSESKDRARGLDMGAIDFISKPFDTSELKARVRNALRTQHLMKMLEQKAQIDALTGIGNRRYFDQRLIQEISQAKRHPRPFSLVLCDLDRFKRLNDRFKHTFGDVVLERVAQILSGGRTSDIVCRWGGEEFGLILPSTNVQQGYEVAERLRIDIELAVWPGKQDLVVTASFGICDTEIFSEEVTPKAMLDMADSALYTAKQNGRNRVEVARKKKSIKIPLEKNNSPSK
ncbi:MAG: diguanylate cyclase [Phycisphaerales bacterium]|nr:diguanylate cyclase [Phycisphaerales bacterium]